MSDHNFSKVGFAFFGLAIFFFALSFRAENIELKRVPLPFIKWNKAAPILANADALAEDEDTSTNVSQDSSSLIIKTISDIATKDSLKTPISSGDSSAAKSNKRKQYDPITDTTKYKERVLLIGDSQNEKLRLPFFNICQTNGSKLIATVIWYGSTTTSWANSDTLEYFIKTFKPTTVLFAIGLNEVFVINIEERKEDMRKITALFERYKVKYCWLGPAAWTQDKGIVEGMRQVAGRHFYDASKLKITRDKDGHHPSKEGGKIWADSVALFASKNLNIDFSKPVQSMEKLRDTRTILITK
jgi:hypothetical protein